MNLKTITLLTSCILMSTKTMDSSPCLIKKFENFSLKEALLINSLDQYSLVLTKEIFKFWQANNDYKLYYTDNNVPKDNNLTKRHNAIVDIIRNMCRDARLNPTLEPTNLFTDISTSTSAHPQQPNAKRPDIMIPSSPIHNHATVILDITIPHPTQDKHVIKTLPKCNIKNKNYLSYKMELAYRLKEKHYKKEANQYNLQVIPIVLDTHGAFHPELDKLIKQCSNAISQDKGLSTHNINHYWTTTISSTLQSWNTRILRERLTRVHDQSSKSADELDRTYDMEME